MITNKEIKAVELSPTKKDFYQIWNELLDTAAKISERWDPASTNEGDPGIVLLKVLTAVADKLNYNVDANSLENFLPSAAQEESMRKLTEMLGYDMKYYQSATTDVKISYNSNNKDAINGIVYIDAYTNLKNSDDTINYITTSPVRLTSGQSSRIVPCIEGELVECETDDDNIISILQLDDNNRYYLPETQIAENGIFITNINNGEESKLWTKVNNLNTQNLKQCVYKFGFDSKENLPYIQFPEDISSIIEDGLKIKYLRTNGINGNISANTLCKMITPASWSSIESSDADYFNPDNYTVTNLTASTNGRNKEGLNDAYNSFKKTIGTFDTLITCRDYMNAIYNMLVDDSSGHNLVSNVIVSDIRDDINKAVTLCTFTSHGIEYKNVARPIYVKDAYQIVSDTYNDFAAQLNIKIKDQTYITFFKAILNKPSMTAEQFETECYNKYFGNLILGQLFAIYETQEDLNNGASPKFYARCMFNGNSFEFSIINTNRLTHFDLVLYPFRPVFGLNSKAEYIKSFKYDDSNNLEIINNLEENKTISHNFISPNGDELACIKNYLRLRAKISTTHKVNELEQVDILKKVYASLYSTFNMRKVDFGEELPYDYILSTIENADPRIKSVNLEEPELDTRFCTVSGGEYSTSAEAINSLNTILQGDRYFNKLVLNNVLAGRVPLFNYDTEFEPDYTEATYPSWTNEGDEDHSYSIIYPQDNTAGIYNLHSKFEIKGENATLKNVLLNDNEVVQFRFPNLKTLKTYPAYVNYYIKLNLPNGQKAIPATLQTILDFITDGYTQESDLAARWEKLNAINGVFRLLEIATENKTEQYLEQLKHGSSVITAKHAIFTLEEVNGSQVYKYVQDWDTSLASKDWYYPVFDNTTLATWVNWFRSGTEPNAKNTLDSVDPTNPRGLTDIAREDIYEVVDTKLTRNMGKLVDNAHTYYRKIDTVKAATKDPFKAYFVARLWSNTTSDVTSIDNLMPGSIHTQDGLGQNRSWKGILANQDYKLKNGEYLLINYTDSKTVDGNDVKTVQNIYYGADTLIRPNMELVSSDELVEVKKFNKQDGFNFRDFNLSPQPTGMYTLGPNEQIEVRDFVQVNLTSSESYIYWELNEEIPDYHNRIYFPWNEEPVNINGERVYTAYTLKEGEYFYYTDKNKLDLAYYGAGTKIKRTPYTPRIYKYSTDAIVSAENIMSNGLTAAIPWRMYNFSKNGEADCRLELTEYQYINLVKGDTLCTVSNSNADLTNLSNNIDVSITEEPLKIRSASYQLAGSDSEQKLPDVDFGNGNNELMWEVRSLLNINLNTNQAQVLHSSNNGNVFDSIELLDLNKNLIETLIPHNDTPLLIKANKTIQFGGGTVSVTTKTYAEDGHLEDEIADLKLKVLGTNTLTLNKNSQDIVNLNNFGDNFTKLNFTEALNGYIPLTSLNIVVPEKDFGLVMLYNVKIDETNAENISITLSRLNETAEELTEVEAAPTIYNLKNPDTQDPTWWYTALPQNVNPRLGGKVNEEYIWATEASIFKHPQDLQSSNLDGLYAKEIVSIAPTLEDTETIVYNYIADKHLTNIYSRVNFNTDEWDKNALYGVIDENKVEIVSFTKISNAAFNEYVAQSSLQDTPLWIKTIEYDAERIVPEAYYSLNDGYEYIYDYNNNNLYKYTLCDSNTIASANKTYGKLLETGGAVNRYCLRTGLNIIKVTKSCKLNIFMGSSQEDSLIIGPLSLINKENPLNEKLMFKSVSLESSTNTSILNDILFEINKIDEDYAFYYNAPVTNSFGIDLNPKDKDDHMENPLNWYDKNNINNKFVISEIDADFLRENVVITKASKTNI